MVIKQVLLMIVLALPTLIHLVWWYVKDTNNPSINNHGEYVAITLIANIIVAIGIMKIKKVSEFLDRL